METQNPEKNIHSDLLHRVSFVLRDILDVADVADPELRRQRNGLHSLLVNDECLVVVTMTPFKLGILPPVAIAEEKAEGKGLVRLSGVIDVVESFDQSENLRPNVESKGIITQLPRQLLVQHDVFIQR